MNVPFPPQRFINRRQALAGLAGGFGSLAMAGLLNQQARAESGLPGPHHPPRARRAIFLFMSGGPSQIDTFDPKPKLAKWEGKRLPVLDGNTNKLLGIVRPLGNAFPSPWTFQKYGQAGIDVSDLFPEVAGCADELCVLRSVCCDSFFHAQGTLEMMTGSGLFLRPSIGSWLLYGLGTESQDIPGFIVLGNTLGNTDPTKVFGSSFLPASFQATHLHDLKNPIPNLEPAAAVAQQRRQLDALRRLNELHRQRHPSDSELQARIESFELAFRMQVTAPRAFDLEGETEATRRMYGIGEKETDEYGRKCLLARRLAERGVRFLVVNHTNWDQHSRLEAGHAQNARQVDRPIAGLLRDLRQRGLLEDTLVIWGGEFGRTPNSEGKDGRDHNTAAFTMWMAGGGIRAGHVHGVTDEFGAYIEEGRIHTHDLHATILHLMGLDHQRLTYRHSGRDFRLTDVAGNIVREILA